MAMMLQALALCMGLLLQIFSLSLAQYCVVPQSATDAVANVVSQAFSDCSTEGCPCPVAADTGTAVIVAAIEGAIAAEPEESCKVTISSALPQTYADNAISVCGPGVDLSSIVDEPVGRFSTPDISQVSNAVRRCSGFLFGLLLLVSYLTLMKRFNFGILFYLTFMPLTKKKS